MCIIVPCFNEALRFKTEDYRENIHRTDFDLVFVNDASQDHTVEVIESLIKSCPEERVHLLHLPSNRGKAGAIREGVLYLQQTSGGKYSQIGYADADAATPLDEVLRLSNILSENDKLWGVMGSRVRLLGRRITRGAFRHYLGRVFATLASHLLRMAVYDTQCGAKVFRSDILYKACRTPFKTRWIFDVEILLRLQGLCGDVADPAKFLSERIYEEDLKIWTHQKGSHIRLMTIFKAALAMLGLYLDKQKIIGSYRNAEGD